MSKNLPVKNDPISLPIFYWILPGLCAGVLTGLSTSAVVGSIVSFLITGASIAIGFFPKHRMADPTRFLRGLGILALALLLGCFLGLYLRVNHVFYSLSHAQETYQALDLSQSEIKQLIIAERTGMITDQEKVVSVSGDALAIRQSNLYSSNTSPELLDQLAPERFGSYRKTIKQYQLADQKVYGSEWALVAKRIEEQRTLSDLSEDHAYQFLKYYWSIQRSLSQVTK